MRVIRLFLAALIFMSSSAAAYAQEWEDFTSREDRFTVNMPGQPKVETIQWPSDTGWSSLAACTERRGGLSGTRLP